MSEHLARGTRRGIVLLTMGLLLALLSSGCRNRSGSNCCPCGPDGGAPIVDTRLMAFLSLARSAHHQADACEEKGDLQCATRSLQKVLQEKELGGGEAPIEWRQVMSDTLARLADLATRQKQYDRARRLADQGLSYAEKGSYFEGHLLEVRGINEQKWAAACKDKGDENGAKAHEAQATKDLAEAVRIQQRVIEELLPKGAPSSNPSQRKETP